MSLKDDAKLVEGATGERLVYKRRGIAEPVAGTPQARPRRLQFLLDVSGSMYRFNGEVCVCVLDVCVCVLDVCVCA